MAGSHWAALLRWFENRAGSRTCGDSADALPRGVNYADDHDEHDNLNWRIIRIQCIVVGSADAGWPILKNNRICNTAPLADAWANGIHLSNVCLCEKTCATGRRVGGWRRPVLSGAVLCGPTFGLVATACMAARSGWRWAASQALGA